MGLIERKRLLTCDDLVNGLVEAPAQVCVKCTGLRYINHMLCDACSGEGRVVKARKEHWNRTLLAWSLICLSLALALGDILWKALR